MTFSIYYVLQIIGILLPAAGLAALLINREQNAPSLRLAVADAGCLIMNSAYFLMITAKDESGADAAFKMEAAGNMLYFIFFLLFVGTYLRISMPKLIPVLWAVFECFFMTAYWSENIRSGMIGRLMFYSDLDSGIHSVRNIPAVFYYIRSGLLLLLLIAGIAYTLKKHHSASTSEDKHSLVLLVLGQAAVTVPFAVQLIRIHFTIPAYDIVPLAASVSVSVMIFSFMKGEFYGVTDIGRQWVSDQMKNAYVLTDSAYGYLDSNNIAEELFPELNECEIKELIPVSLYEMFTSDESYYNIGDRYYNKEVRDLHSSSNSVSGYGMFLEDVTEERERINYLKDYNTRLMDDINKATKHLRVVQDSIITGIASVVESRDNSTGGHINRTSTVVKIFARKLIDTPDVMYQLHIDRQFLENVEKAAPMHDLGKIAVDDEILRKPGRFTDEEYAKMKKHSEEGAKVLKRVLIESDDLDFVNIAINVAHYHHERWDGRGYPNELSGEAIPLEARIMALADVFDALVSKRCYKEAFGYDKAFSIIEEGLGTQFDPVLGKVFIECRPELEAYYNISQ